jgi:hypothetical protein
MPTREENLATRTHKEEGLDTGRRVFYTLTDDKDLAGHRSAKLLALLIENLVQRGRLSERDLDNMLLEIVP